MNAVTYSGHRHRIDADLTAGTVTVTPYRGGQPWTVPLYKVEAVGLRYSTLIKRGTLRLLVRGQTWEEITDSSPNAVGQPRAVPRGGDDDPMAFATALGQLGIPTVPLDGKGRAAKIGKLSMWSGGEGF
ncbi:hypothetical protein [Mycolicibacterium fortuitum]|uniref:hypothetical protein n=1 Tax=Mycolicibacterium fortuitum TaxID=1766 RepID=UPI002613D902|nr:hypothetical protein [Mycolicibacterium fortuitum]